MWWLIAPAALFIFLIWYALSGRAMLKTKPWAQPTFARIEPIETVLYRKSETILWARFKMLTGVSLTLLTQIGAIDITPIMPLVPDKYSGPVRIAFNLLPLIITVIGMMDEKLRNATSQPMELVALPDKAITPRIAEALALADSTRTEAVAVVKDAANVKDAAKCG